MNIIFILGNLIDENELSVTIKTLEKLKEVIHLYKCREGYLKDYSELINKKENEKRELETTVNELRGDVDQIKSEKDDLELKFREWKNDMEETIKYSEDKIKDLGSQEVKLQMEISHFEKKLKEIKLQVEQEKRELSIVLQESQINGVETNFNDHVEEQK